MSDTTTPSGRDRDIAPVTIEEEMRRSYLDYAMSVIVARALPDARDGLKPVHRRILYGMKAGGYDANKPYRKSAKIVGEVMGNYHPHGDGAIYDALVRLAQPFSMRLPLIDGQGNFGSMDGDPPAAMRYTESRLAKAGEAILADYDLDTVDFQPNYDDSSEEPTVLPSRIPNLLVNGAGGIAVGMATNIPTHNLGEVIDACIALVDNPLMGLPELMEIVPGPDFPTGGMIIGRAGVRSAYLTGNGSVVMRAKTHIEDSKKDRQAIVIDELPYQINVTKLYERIKELISDKIVEGISDVRDESDRSGVRIVVELRRDAVADVVLNQLFRHTALQSNFPVNMLALDQGRPRMFTLKDCLTAFIVFREEVISRRTAHLLGVARARAHILAGLAVAVANIDEMIQLIRRAPDPATARAEMTGRDWPATEVAPLIRLIDEPGNPLSAAGTYRLSEEQAKAILDLRLHRLTGLERDKIGDELTQVVAEISELLSILASREKLLGVLKDELAEIKTQFATPRRTVIEDGEADSNIEDLIAREDMVVTITGGGYIKRVALSAYRAQNRGGKGRSGMATKEEDFVAEVFVASTHTPLLIFTSRGLVYALKVYRLPLGNPQSKGKALVNLLPFQQGETVSAVMAMPENEGDWGDLHIVFATAQGGIRRNVLSDFTSIRSNGLIAMKFDDDGDRLIGVRTCRPEDDILLSTRFGKAIRFPVDEVRVFAGRSSTGVRGIRLADGDEVISLSILTHVEADADERAAYMKQANALRRTEGEGEEPEIVAADDEADGEGSITISPERFLELAATEEMILTISEQGLGKRTSAYGFRLTGRGGQGISAMALTGRSGKMAACFPVKETDQIMLVSDGGQLIRLPVAQIRIAGRQTQGVTLFRLASGEKVVSVADLTGEAAEAEAEGGPEEQG